MKLVFKRIDFFVDLCDFLQSDNELFCFRGKLSDLVFKLSDFLKV